MKNEAAKQYLKRNKNLTTLNGKTPIRKDWTEKKLSEQELSAHNGNLGWVLGASDFVVDVDPKNGGKESYKKLIEDLSLELTPTVSTPSGGFHVYLSIPDEFKGKSFRKTLNKIYPGIDFLTKGTQCVISGSVTDKGCYEWADDLFDEFVQVPAPANLLELISYSTDVATTGNSELGDFDGIVGGSSSHWSEDNVVGILAKLDPSMPNDDWVRVGMALHDWDPVKGLIHWENWSLAGDNYQEGQTEARWKSFDLGGGVTLGTIAYMAKGVDFDDEYERVNSYISNILNSDEKNITLSIAPKIAKDLMSTANREKISKAIQDRLFALTDVKLGINVIRDMIAPNHVANGHLIDLEDSPEWCEKWVYVTTHNAYLDGKTLAMNSAEGFNIENGKYVPPGPNGSKPSASRYVADNGYIDKVDSLAYLPTYNNFICEIEGRRVANTFNPASIPIEASEMTEIGIEAIERIKKHIKFICTTDENAEIFTQWLAHQVQFPGRQILWSPVIQAIQGVGKSFFGELLRACLGDRNVGTVSPTQVTSNFNGWATNVIVNVLEELRVVGQNRHEAVNALKPLITDRMIQINEKGVKPYMTYNTANYMCFTNYKDSLPLDDNDRRWWVLFVQIDSLEDMAQVVGESAVTYFPKLFDAVRNNRSEVRKWLLDYEISDEFLATKQAPMTDEKRSMIATEDDNFEGYEELKELINEGGEYWNRECVSSGDIFAQLAFDHPDIEVNTRGKNMLLKKLGYSKQSGKIKIDGKSRVCWSKHAMTNDEVRASLLKYNNGNSKKVEDYFE